MTTYGIIGYGEMGHWFQSHIPEAHIITKKEEFVSADSYIFVAPSTAIPEYATLLKNKFVITTVKGHSSPIWLSDITHKLAVYTGYYTPPHPWAFVFTTYDMKLYETFEGMYLGSIDIVKQAEHANALKNLYILSQAPFRDIMEEIEAFNYSREIKDHLINDILYSRFNGSRNYVAVTTNKPQPKLEGYRTLKYLREHPHELWCDSQIIKTLIEEENKVL
ncbi:MAG: hypothetical protein QXL94_01970 [Candidatus Parvarchaeum sp.]